MYAKEMRRNRDNNEDGGGDGDKVDSKTSSDTDRDDFSVSYGNYGDPHSFAPYQLILLVVDFIFNWAMDIAHEDPLAVLVIFIFQSLSILVNVILYIMAAASQAMQVGVQRRVTIHHWLNMSVCLCYIILTGWWFIWALKKSWPSVSDQFSFTWPATDLEEINRANAAAAGATGNSSVIKNPRINASQRLTAESSSSQIKEHYSLWSPGFSALYVVHRTVAILYYFSYLRATFLYLNTPTMDKFIERKKHLVERLEEIKKTSYDDASSRPNLRERRKITSSKSFPVPSSSASLGLDEYLSEHADYFLENEGQSQKKGHEGKSQRRQILWADDDNVNLNDKNNANLAEDDEIEFAERKSKQKSKKKGKQKHRRELEEEQEDEDNDRRTNRAEDGEKVSKSRSEKFGQISSQSQSRERKTKKKSRRDLSDDGD